MPKHNGNAVITYTNFRNFNQENFQRDLESVPWDSIYNINNIDNQVKFLKNITHLLDKHAFLVTSIFIIRGILHG